MAETVTNRGKIRIIEDGLAALDLRMGIILGTTTGVHNADLDTVADLDAVSGVSIHSERVALTGESFLQNDTDDRAEADAANVIFASAAGVTALGVVIYDEGSGSDATRDIISLHTTNFPQPMDSGLLVTINDILRAS